MENFDFVIFGTGIIESLLVCELAKYKKKILVIDENGLYGSDIVTLNYKELIKKFKKEPVPELEKLSKEFCIDIVPKVFMVNGGIQTLMEKYNITEMVKFRLLEGSFIYKSDKINKIPTNEKDSLKTSLVSFFEKPKLVRFFWNLRKYAETGKYSFKQTMKEEYKLYGISRSSQELFGHAIALNLDDHYLNQHPKEFFDKIVLYMSSLVTQNNISSPYIFPEYGLSEIPQILSRIGSINNAVYRLNTKLNSLDITEEGYVLHLTDFENKSFSISSNAIISNPTYFKDDIILKYKVIRNISIIKDTCKIINGCASGSVIFLSSDLNRKNDIFLLILGNKQKVCPKGYSIAIISTIKETEDPEAEIEIVTSRLGNIIQSFTYIDDVYEGKESIPGFYITKSIDHTPSIESGFREFDLLFQIIKDDLKL